MDPRTTGPRERGRTAAALFVPALLFGVLLAAQWQTQVARSELDVRYNAPLTETARALQAEQSDLKGQLAELRRGLDSIQANASTQTAATRELQARIDDLKARAGLAPLRGDGVTVRLDDPKLTATTGKEVDKAVCHATDLTDIINTAWRGGAAAVAVNDERIVGTSSVYCVGSQVMVNGTLMSTPFTVVAVGPQDRLLEAFNDPAQLRDIRERSALHGLELRISRASGLQAPEYSGALNVRAAVPK